MVSINPNARPNFSHPLTKWSSIWSTGALKTLHMSPPPCVQKGRC